MDNNIKFEDIVKDDKIIGQIKFDGHRTEKQFTALSVFNKTYRIADVNTKEEAERLVYDVFEGTYRE